MDRMRAARLHVPGGDFQIDEIPRPRPGGMDVLVEIKATGVVPNLRNVMNNYGDRAYLTVPELPAIYGLDAAGVVVETGPEVRAIHVGDRVYLNPGRSCGSCEACRGGDAINCPAYTFQGYFGFGPGSRDIYKRYPYGGFCQFATAPTSGLVKLPDSVSFESASRFGYLGTAYSALRKAGVRAGSSVLINGATGTLGVGAVLLARAMGATRILCVARKRPLLERLLAIDSKRIRICPEGGESIAIWAQRESGGLGVDAVIDTLGPSADAQAMQDAIEALRRGGRLVNVGGMSMPLPINMHHLMCVQKSLIGSLWFSVGEGQEMAELAAAGLLDLSVFEHQVFTLDEVNDALRLAEQRAGGFINVLIRQ
jgi:alcohol dehydrogenase